MKRVVLSFSVALFATFVTPATALGGGCHSPTDGEMEVARTEGAAASAHADDCGFYPAVLYVDEGAEVTWTNKDPVPHTITGAQLSWGSEEAFDLGEEASFSFQDAGVFPYYCVIHPGMVGAVVVGDPDPDQIAMTATKTLDQDLDDTSAASDSKDDDSSTQPMTLAGIALVGAVAGGAIWLSVRRRRVTPAA